MGLQAAIRSVSSRAVKTVLLLSLHLCASLPSYGQDQLLPVNVQVPLLLKVMSYDRNLKAGTGDEIVMGVVYQSNVRASVNVKNEFELEWAKSSNHSIGGTSVHCVFVDMNDDENSLKETVQRNHVDILYVAPFRSMSLQRITSVSRSFQLPTITAVSEYVESGLAIGLVEQGLKPQIIINLSFARAEGIDFDSRLLRIAKVIP
jgi:hypothetical protein